MKPLWKKIMVLPEKPLEMCVEVQMLLFRFSDFSLRGFTCSFPRGCHVERRLDLEEVELIRKKRKLGHLGYVKLSSNSQCNRGCP